jgi:hypothetical protein
VPYPIPPWSFFVTWKEDVNSTIIIPLITKTGAATPVFVQYPLYL